MKAPKEKKREGPNQRIQIQLALHNEMDAFVSAGAHTAGKTVPKSRAAAAAVDCRSLGLRWWDRNGTSQKKTSVWRVFITAT